MYLSVQRNNIRICLSVCLSGWLALRLFIVCLSDQAKDYLSALVDFKHARARGGSSAELLNFIGMCEGQVYAPTIA